MSFTNRFRPACRARPTLAGIVIAFGVQWTQAALAQPVSAADPLATLVNAYRAAPGICDGSPAAPAPALV
ncbi:hypothetical protein FPK51_29035, partial [Acinetobacter baumannii]|nr:hypothetical protein [Acinetobacter baumannii]